MSQGHLMCDCLSEDAAGRRGVQGRMGRSGTRHNFQGRTGRDETRVVRWGEAWGEA